MLCSDASLRLLIGVDTGWEPPPAGSEPPPAGSDLAPWQEPPEAGFEPPEAGFEPPEAGPDLAPWQEPPEAGSEPPEAGSVLPVAAMTRGLGAVACVHWWPRGALLQSNFHAIAFQLDVFAFFKR